VAPPVSPSPLGTPGQTAMTGRLDKALDALAASVDAVENAFEAEPDGADLPASFVSELQAHQKKLEAFAVELERRKADLEEEAEALDESIDAFRDASDRVASLAESIAPEEEEEPA
jgi:hypothetical protein